jgi:cation diffusion facilitator CzcD-associated flavoprotein CzcO
VPSHLHSFSFAPNPRWSRSFPAQPEIWAYLRHCARRFGILPHLRLRHEVRQASWDDRRQRWRVETSRGDWTADVLVAATGPLSEPKLPALPGLDGFEGAVFHSASWDHDHDLTGAESPSSAPGRRRSSSSRRSSPGSVGCGSSSAPPPGCFRAATAP